MLYGIFSLAKGCTKLVMKGTAPVGRPRNTWQDSVSVDLCLRDAQDRTS